MSRGKLQLNLIGLVMIGSVSVGYSDEPLQLSIFDIQSNTEEDGDWSVYDGEIVHCDGGIVVGKYRGRKPRIILQDPDYMDGWGAIQVKDWTVGCDLYDNEDVVLGAWVELTFVLVEESWGSTMVHWNKPSDPPLPVSGFEVIPTGLPLPQPIIVAVSDITAPIEGLSGDWYVTDHDAEPYESMRVIVRDVTVTTRSLGSHSDNYNLQTPGLDDCWAADYMNKDVPEDDFYHEWVTVEQHFCAVVGVLEQYSNTTGGWDYYQLVTMSAADLVLCGDGDSDGDLDIDDWPRFHDCFTGPVCNNTPGGCDQPEWEPPVEQRVQHCLMMDMDYDGDVDLFDYASLQIIFGTDYTETKGGGSASLVVK